MRQAPKHPATLIKIVALLALMVLATTSALAASRSARKADSPRATIRAASDSLSISNSQAAGAVFAAGNIAPGDQVIGTATIGNTGNIAGDFTLAPANLSDTPGPNGGALSAALDLTVEDMTSNTTLYNGKLNAFSQRSLGTWQPGQSRNYRFAAALPDTGTPSSTTSGDNLYSGASTSLQLNWTASGDGSPGAGPTGPGGPTPTPMVLTITGKKSLKLSKKTKGFTYSATCSSSCTLSASATVKSRKSKKKQPKTLFKLRSASASASATKPALLRFKLSKQQARKIGNALRTRRSAYVDLTVTATSPNGDKLTRTARVAFKR